jgi:hypothetical protein
MGAAGSAAGTENTSAPVSVSESATVKGNVSVTDVELMREALMALEPLAQCAEDSPCTSPDHRTLYDGAFVGIVLGDARRARAIITKLEERLLKE